MSHPISRLPGTCPRIDDLTVALIRCLLQTERHVSSLGCPMNEMAAAAQRHFRCALTLHNDKESGEACYLIGLAAECATKSYLLEAGFNLKKRGLNDQELRDPVFLHFPDLATVLLAQGGGIVSERILSKIGHADFLQGWSVKMRYKRQQSDRTMVKRFQKWSAQTTELFGEFGL